MMSDNLNVLVLCTGNSCRSQMAAGLLRNKASEHFNVYSAGTKPADAVHPLAVEVIGELGIDISDQRPASVTKYLGTLHVNYLLVVCSGAHEHCPRVFPGMQTKLFWPFDDPAKFEGSPEAKIEKFRAVRDEIAARIDQWLGEEPWML